MSDVIDRLKNIEPELVHTPLYDFNDDIIVTGAAYWLNVVQQELGAAAA